MFAFCGCLSILTFWLRSTSIGTGAFSYWRVSLLNFVSAFVSTNVINKLLLFLLLLVLILLLLLLLLLLFSLIFLKKENVGLLNWVVVVVVVVVLIFIFIFSLLWFCFNYDLVFLGFNCSYTFEEGVFATKW